MERVLIPRVRGRSNFLARTRAKPSSAQKAIQQAFQQQAIFQVHSQELDAQALARNGVSHDRFGANASAGHFKRNSDFRTY